MAKTAYRNYEKPLVTDAYDVNVFNENFDKIDNDINQCMTAIDEVEKEIRASAKILRGMTENL